MLGSGFEDIPKLIDTLDKRFGVIGCGGETVRQVKDPFRLAEIAARIGLAMPDMRVTPPSRPDGWLIKSIGGSGGGHVRWSQQSCLAKPKRYWQRHVVGASFSVIAVAGAARDTFRLSRQWTSAATTRPFRYGGAVAIDTDECAVAPALLDAAAALIDAFALKGVVSFDFIVADGAPYLLEINPRPGATLDIFDTAAGDLFRAHVKGAQPSVATSDHGKRASAILYADRGPLIAPAVDWPDWAADRPVPGSTIPNAAPLASVNAEAEAANAAECLVRKRLDELANLLYGPSYS